MPRATQTHGPGTRRSGTHSRSLGGRRAATSRSTLAGQHLTTRTRCDVSRWNSSPYSLISFFRADSHALELFPVIRTDGRGGEALAAPVPCHRWHGPFFSKA